MTLHPETPKHKPTIQGSSQNFDAQRARKEAGHSADSTGQEVRRRPATHCTPLCHIPRPSRSLSGQRSIGDESPRNSVQYDRESDGWPPASQAQLSAQGTGHRHSVRPSPLSSWKRQISRRGRHARCSLPQPASAMPPTSQVGTLRLREAPRQPEATKGREGISILGQKPCGERNLGGFRLS